MSWHARKGQAFQWASMARPAAAHLPGRRTHATITAFFIVGAQLQPPRHLQRGEQTLYAFGVTSFWATPHNNFQDPIAFLFLYASWRDFVLDQLTSAYHQLATFLYVSGMTSFWTRLRERDAHHRLVSIRLMA